MTEVVTYEEVKSFLLELASEFPDRAPGCHYSTAWCDPHGDFVSDGEPLCIAAHVADKFGVFHLLKEGNSWGCQSFKVLDRFDAAANGLIFAAQYVQDAGYPWSRAVKDAIAHPSSLKRENCDPWDSDEECG